MMFDTRLRIVREAVDVVLRRLEGLAASDMTEQLRVWVQECQQETDRWRSSPPTARERDVLMKRVLALHVEVTRLERDDLFQVRPEIVSEACATARVVPVRE